MNTASFDASLRALQVPPHQASSFTGCAIYQSIDVQTLRLSAPLRDDISKAIREAVAAELRIVKVGLRPGSVLDIRPHSPPGSDEFFLEIVKVLAADGSTAGHAGLVNERARDILLFASER